jgi:hypothetical protein
VAVSKYEITIWAAMADAEVTLSGFSRFFFAAIVLNRSRCFLGNVNINGSDSFAFMLLPPAFIIYPVCLAATHLAVKRSVANGERGSRLYYIRHLTAIHSSIIDERR